ncbi:MAG: MMPL family transporter [Pirellula sp.]
MHTVLDNASSPVSRSVAERRDDMVSKLHAWSYWAVVASICLFPILVYQAMGLRIGSASAHAWLPEGRAERIRYEEFLKAFGSDQYLIVSWDECRLEDSRVADFASQLFALDNHPNSLIDSLHTTQDILQTLTERPLSLPVEAAVKRLAGSMMGADGTAAVFIRFTREGVSRQKDSIELTRKAAEHVPGLGKDKIRMVGSVYEAYAVDDAAEMSLRTLVLPSSILGVVLAWLCLRSARSAAAVLIIAGMGQLLAVAFVSVTGGEFSAVLIVLPTLVFMLTLSAAVHFMNYYADVSHSYRDRLGARAVLLGLKPSVLATLTTSFGMAALATSQLAPVRTFGLYSATTLCLATVFLVLVFPRLADWFCSSQFGARAIAGADECDDSNPNAIDARPVAAWATNYTAWVQRNAWQISAGGLALILFSIYGLLHLKSSTKFDDMFPKESSTVRDMAWIEAHLGPIASVEILMKFPSEPGDDAYHQIEWVDRVVRHLREQPEIGGVVAATTFLPQLPSGGRVRDVVKRGVFRSAILNELDSIKKQGFLAESDGQRIWRVTAKVSALSKLNYGQLTDRARKAVSQVQQNNVGINDPALHGVGLPFRAEYTGLSPIMHDTQLALLDDLGSSFTTAFLLITPVMILIARSIRAGLLIMIPNVLPETLVFGGMAWLGYSIDIAGILTASVAMGIAVNDTLHFVNWYTHRLSLGDTRQQAVADTFFNCARAMLHTMLISCCSMLPFMFSEFLPTRQFAMLMIAMLSSSILGDLVLLPALLLSPLGKLKNATTESCSVERRLVS